MLRTPGILLVDPPLPPLNSKNLAHQFWHPIGWAPLTHATGAPAETRILSGIISTNIRAGRGLTVRPREKSYFTNSA